MDILQTLSKLATESGFAGFFANGGWKNLIMIAVACLLLYLGIGKKFEPLLLVGIAFGVLLTNIPGAGLYHMGMWDAYVYECAYDPVNDYALYNTAEERAYNEMEMNYYIVARASGHTTEQIEDYFEKQAGADATNDFMALYATCDQNAANELAGKLKGELSFTDIIHLGGLLDILYIGVKAGVYPCLIFIGVGAMTDFGPLIANPKSLLLGAAAQFGIFATFLGALALGFNYWEAGSIGIIGGADGPTSIYLTSKLAPSLLAPIAVAAYSYMALVPVIQPPIMKALTTEKERKIEMKQLRSVSKTEKILFPIIITIIISLLLPSAAPLIGCLMLGNLLKECGVTERLSKTVQNELMNIVTIFLGISVGATATAATFLSGQTIKIMVMGVIAFSLGSASGVILAKVINLFSKEKINPLIGSAGVSAVPMAARVSQTVGQKYNPGNFLLMHAMGPNVAGVIGSAVAAGILLSFFPVA